MRHRLKWFVHLQAQGLSKGDEHPTNTPHEVCYFFLLPGDIVLRTVDSRLSLRQITDAEAADRAYLMCVLPSSTDCCKCDLTVIYLISQSVLRFWQT